MRLFPALMWLANREAKEKILIELRVMEQDDKCWYNSNVCLSILQLVGKLCLLAFSLLSLGKKFLTMMMSKNDTWSILYKIVPKKVPREHYSKINIQLLSDTVPLESARCRCTNMLPHIMAKTHSTHIDSKVRLRLEKMLHMVKAVAKKKKWCFWTCLCVFICP